MASTWLVKTEPETFGWADLVQEQTAMWDGVRSLEARKHLRAMKVGDSVFVYHSGKERAVVGLGVVVREAYPDPTAEEGDWSAVDIRAERAVKVPVTLATIKADKAFAECPLVRRARLSVMPIEPALFRRLLILSGGDHAIKPGKAPAKKR